MVAPGCAHRSASGRVDIIWNSSGKPFYVYSNTSCEGVAMHSLGGQTPGRKANAGKNMFPKRKVDVKEKNKLSKKVGGVSQGQGPRRAGKKGKGWHVAKGFLKKLVGFMPALAGALVLPVSLAVAVALYLR